MHLKIAPDQLISDLQKQFNDFFPYLKLEFFNNKSFARNNFSASQIIPGNKKLNDGQLNLKKEKLKIEENMKVSELENLFKEKFKLAVQVFRKSGNLWLETTMTDNWTLYQQNKHGEELSTSRMPGQVPDDYDLNRDADH